MSTLRRKTEAMHAKQNEQTRARAAVITKMLNQLLNAKIKPDNRTAISKLLAEKISEVEGKPCSNTTILRSKVYGRLIEQFMSDSGYVVTQKNKGAQNNLLSAQLEIRELRKENEHLNRLLEKSLSNIALLENEGQNSSTRKVPINDSVDRFCRIINMLLERLGTDIDKQLRVVTDTYDHSILFDQSTLPEYFKWMEKN
ncbi:hypothetical protein [uncultured Methylophaga sp.]|uniref:hypothetical protein n=1 Tax=uncultured Methylophaga sp. TaxID=285271 RepID=UPI00261708A5|nr:hypothetical protein [uncultured Methylophaga sp.]